MKQAHWSHAVREACRKPGDARTEDDIQTILSFAKDSSKFLQTLEETQQAALCRAVTLEEFKRDKMVFDFGEVGDKFYIVLSGHLQVLSPQGPCPTGEHALERCTCKNRPFEALVYLERGMGFGELALQNDQPRSGRVITMERTELLVVQRAAYNAYAGEQHRLFIKDRVSFMKQCRCFSDALQQGVVSMKDLCSMAGCLQERQLTGQAVICRQGDVSESIFFVRSGRLLKLRVVDVEKVQQENRPGRAVSESPRKKSDISEGSTAVDQSRPPQKKTVTIKDADDGQAGQEDPRSRTTTESDVGGRVVRKSNSVADMKQRHRQSMKEQFHIDINGQEEEEDEDEALAELRLSMRSQEAQDEDSNSDSLEEGGEEDLLSDVSEEDEEGEEGDEVEEVEEAEAEQGPAFAQRKTSRAAAVAMKRKAKARMKERFEKYMSEESAASDRAAAPVASKMAGKIGGKVGGKAVYAIGAMKQKTNQQQKQQKQQKQQQQKQQPFSGRGRGRGHRSLPPPIARPKKRLLCVGKVDPYEYIGDQLLVHDQTWPVSLVSDAVANVFVLSKYDVLRRISNKVFSALFETDSTTEMLPTDRQLLEMQRRTERWEAYRKTAHLEVSSSAHSPTSAVILRDEDRHFGREDTRGKMHFLGFDGSSLPSAEVASHRSSRVNRSSVARPSIRDADDFVEVTSAHMRRATLLQHDRGLQNALKRCGKQNSSANMSNRSPGGLEYSDFRLEQHWHRVAKEDPIMQALDNALDQVKDPQVSVFRRRTSVLSCEGGAKRRTSALSCGSATPRGGPRRISTPRVPTLPKVATMATAAAVATGSARGQRGVTLPKLG